MAKDEVDVLVTTFTKIMSGIKDATMDIMNLHPMCAFVILQLYGHLGYCFIKEKDWNIGGQARETLRDAVAESFFHMGEKLDNLLSTEALKNITPLVGAITGAATGLAGSATRDAQLALVNAKIKTELERARKLREGTK